MGEEDWSPEKHRIIEGDEVRELLPALAPREPTAAYLFYDCQTDDARLVLTVLGEAERFGAVLREPLPRRRAARPTTAAPSACAARTRSRGDEFEIRADERGQRDRRVGGPDPPARSCTTRRRSRASVRAAARTSRFANERPADQRRRDRPGRRRAQHLRAAVARPHADRHDRQRLRGRARARPARRGRHRVPARRRQQVLRDLARPRAHHRRVRGRAAADLDRRPEEVGRHLAQGRAVRDELRASSRSPAASSRPGGGWRRWPSTGSSSARAARRRAARTRSRSG